MNPVLGSLILDSQTSKTHEITSSSGPTYLLTLVKDNSGIRVREFGTTNIHQAEYMHATVIEDICHEADNLSTISVLSGLFTPRPT